MAASLSRFLVAALRVIHTNDTIRGRLKSIAFRTFLRNLFGTQETAAGRILPSPSGDFPAQPQNMIGATRIQGTPCDFNFGPRSGGAERQTTLRVSTRGRSSQTVASPPGRS